VPFSNAIPQKALVDLENCVLSPRPASELA
jgi:hypothetical protein